MVKVSVKWSGKKFDDLDLGKICVMSDKDLHTASINVSTTDVNESPELFKNQIYSVTGVPPERQKIMIKGGTMKVNYIHKYTHCLSERTLPISYPLFLVQDDTDLSKLTVKEVKNSCPDTYVATS